MVPANSFCSVTCSLPKGAFTSISLHVIVSGRLWGAPAGALSRSPRAFFSSSNTLPPPHTHTWVRMFTDWHIRTKCFLLRPAGYSRERQTAHPREHLHPLFPARDTAREQLEYLCLTKATRFAPCVLQCLVPSLPAGVLVCCSKPQPW